MVTFSIVETMTSLQPHVLIILPHPYKVRFQKFFGAGLCREWAYRVHYSFLTAQKSHFSANRMLKTMQSFSEWSSTHISQSQMNLCSCNIQFLQLKRCVNESVMFTSIPYAAQAFSGRKKEEGRAFRKIL